ncbi:MAG: TetR/AcrR family transcriptional regulator [Candidatus Binatus sp.]
MTSQAERRSTTIRAILDAARKLFTARGFEQTSVDDIAARAGVAKGAVYHHFASKELIFVRVFEEMTAELAALVPAAARTGKDVLDSIGRGTLKYLTSISNDQFRQVLLIDGPRVLGWEQWRAIDARYFSGMINAPVEARLRDRASAREIEALGHLIGGALTEAALVCATSQHRARAARDLSSALQRMLAPFFGAPS